MHDTMRKLGGACRVLGQPRAVQRYAARVRDDVAPPTRWIAELASVYGWYGSPRITGMLRNEGWNVAHKRVERIWRQAVAERRQLHPAPAGAEGSTVCILLRRYPDARGAAASAQRLMFWVVVDERTRECLSIDVARESQREGALHCWAAHKENGYLESLNGKPRDKMLNGEIFYTVAEARVLIERWREHYNRVRPHSALGYRPPTSEVIAAGGPPLRYGPSSSDFLVG